MFAEEAHEFGAGPIVGEALRVHALVAKHSIEEHLTDERGERTRPCPLRWADSWT